MRGTPVNPRPAPAATSCRATAWHDAEEEEDGGDEGWTPKGTGKHFRRMDFEYATVGAVPILAAPLRADTTVQLGTSAGARRVTVDLDTSKSRCAREPATTKVDGVVWVRVWHKGLLSNSQPVAVGWVWEQADDVDSPFQLLAPPLKQSKKAAVKAHWAEVVNNMEEQFDIDLKNDWHANYLPLLFQVSPHALTAFLIPHIKCTAGVM